MALHSRRCIPGAGRNPRHVWAKETLGHFQLNSIPLDLGSVDSAEWVVTGSRADAGKAESAATLLGGPAGEACEHC